MFQKFFLIASLSLGCFVGIAQKSVDQGYYDYLRFMAAGDSLYKTQNFLAAARSYSAIRHLKIGNTPIKSFGADYNAACCWALGGEVDSAFQQLAFVVKQHRYTNLEHLTNDTDLASLREDARWEAVLKEVQANIDFTALVKQRTTYQGNSKQYIFQPLTKDAKSILQNDSLPFISVNFDNYRVFFRGDSYAATQLDEIREAFHGAYVRSLQVLDISHYPNGINVVLFEDQEEMKAHTGRGPKGGYALAGHDLVLFNFPKGRVAPPFTHEIFHLISIQSWGPTLRMLMEGSAVYTQRECDHLMSNSIYGVNAYMASKNKLFPLEDLIHHFNEAANLNEVGAYFQSAGIFQYLYEKHGVAKIKQLWQAGFKDFRQIYGQSLEDFEEEYVAFIATQMMPGQVNWDRLFSEGCMDMPFTLKTPASPK